MADALRQAMGAAIRRRGAAGETVVTVQVDSALCEPEVARAGQVGLWSAELEVRVTLLGPAPRSLSLQRATTFHVPLGGDLPTQRSLALERLAALLADEAVELLLYGPPTTKGLLGGES